MRASFQKFSCKLSFLLVLLIGLCQGVQAQTFPVVSLPFPGDSSGAVVDVGLTVIFNPSGFSIPLPGGGTGLFHYKYAYSVTMADDIKLPITVISDFEVLNCLSTLFVAQTPTVLIPPLIGASRPDLFTVPIWTPSNSQIIWSGPVAGPAYGAQWLFCFYSDTAPSVGTLSITGTRINVDCSVEHPVLEIPYFGPCAPPTAPPPVCKTPICSAGGPYSGLVSAPIVFDGSGSSGNGSAIATYGWDFGDGTTGAGVSPTHSYTAPGTYTVLLTITNVCGKSCTCSTKVTITRPPTAPPPCTHNYKVAQVYPALPGPVVSPFKQIGCYMGDTIVPLPSLTVPGVLCLDTLPDNKLNQDAFVTCCPGGVVTLTDVRLIKTVPGSEQFPGCYQPYEVVQIGRNNIRTWWTLNYTQPGTTFKLILTGTCTTPGTPGGGPRICPRHKPGGNWRSSCNCDKPSNPGTPGATVPYSDVWCWTVEANPDTFLLLIDLLHSSAIGLTEVPCITDEAVYDGLVIAGKKMKEAVKKYESQRTAFNKAAALDAILSLQAFIFANCLSADSLCDIAEQIKLPPGNFLSPGSGIWETLENPCCCKMLGDLEAIVKTIDKASPL